MISGFNHISINSADLLPDSFILSKEKSLQLTEFTKNRKPLIMESTLEIPHVMIMNYVSLPDVICYTGQLLIPNEGITNIALLPIGDDQWTISFT